MIVSKQKIEIATRFGLHNAAILANATREVGGISYAAACALMEKESWGANVFGHDAGGAMSGAGEVTLEKWREFRHLVVDLGHTSNGVGPSQITYSGFFPAMEHLGLKPYDVHDNMLYGLRLIRGYWLTHGHSWTAAGTAYNGALVYGQDLKVKVAQWHLRLNP